MNKTQYKCTLLTDVVLNMRSATEGNQSTLDFIPGNCFLGIVARNYEKYGDNIVHLFHDGTVKFGDAHPAFIEMGKMIKRSLRIPYSFYTAKVNPESGKCFIHHFYKRRLDHSGSDGKPLQLKQCREGFYAIDNHQARLALVEKNFAIKSAYDRVLRRAKDEQMYGYESLQKGEIFLFEVATDQPDLSAIIEKELCGKHHIGRSRSSQYGLVEIEKITYEECESHFEPFNIDGISYISVYADGRLVFIDSNGMPTFRPKASDFGLDGEIDWAKSQIRTFQYSPWNYKRQARDADRCGIEKGSVFIIKINKTPSILPNYVGIHQNEGFGKVIYNLPVLSNHGNNGCIEYHIEKDCISSVYPTLNHPNLNLDQITPKSSLVRYLVKEAIKAQRTAYLYKEVNKFVDESKKQHLFKGNQFASQWGAIRDIAVKCANGQEILYTLFEKETEKARAATATNQATSKKCYTAYLKHGVAAKKWQKKKRDKKLQSFIESMMNYEYGDISREALVNLASEMAKICK